MSDDEVKTVTVADRRRRVAEVVYKILMWAAPVVAGLITIVVGRNVSGDGRLTSAVIVLFVSWAMLAFLIFVFLHPAARGFEMNDAETVRASAPVTDPPQGKAVNVYDLAKKGAVFASAVLAFVTTSELLHGIRGFGRAVAFSVLFAVLFVAYMTALMLVVAALRHPVKAAKGLGITILVVAGVGVVVWGALSAYDFLQTADVRSLLVVVVILLVVLVLRGTGGGTGDV